MSAIEDRLRAAAQAVAEATAHQQVPPLRLPEGQPRFGPRRTASPAGPRRARILVPVAAAAAVALVVTGLVVLRQPPQHDQHTSAAGLAKERALAAQQGQRRALDRLVIAAFVPATGPMNEYGGKLEWMIQARELRATARCMARSGYHISGQSGPYDPAAFADNSQMPDLPRIARTHEFVPLTGISVPNYSKAEQRASTSCTQTAAVRFIRIRQLSAPMQNAWWRIVFRIQASARVKAAIPALNTCAARYGFPNDPYGNASGPIRTFADFIGWVAGFLDGAVSRSASTSTLRALDRHWASVFVTCARPIVGLFQRMQLAAQARFLPQHASQLRKLDQAAWQLLGHGSS